VNTKSKNPCFRMSSTLSFPMNCLRSSSSLQSGLFSTVQSCTSASLPVLYLVPMQSAHPVLVLRYNTTFPYSSKIPFFSPVLLLLHLMWASLVLVQSKQEVLILHNHTHTHTHGHLQTHYRTSFRGFSLCLRDLNRIIPLFDRPRCVLRTKHT